MDNPNFLISSTAEKIKFGENLISSLKDYSDIDGTNKLQRKITQEINFLKKILKNGCIKKEHLQCTNLTHFSALIDVLIVSNNCVHVNKSFVLKDKRLTVDIVCDEGLSWIKVIARNPKSISQISMGDTGYGVRSIFDHAEEFLECAKLYPCLFKIPKIVFHFANGIENNLALRLESLGVTVRGNRLVDGSDLNTEPILKSSADTDDKSTSEIQKLNLDVSAMIAYVSSLTNGNCHFKFKVPVLTQQAEWECLRPVKPILDKLFKGKKLYCCQTAKINFGSIVNTVGGPNERIRAAELMKNVIVLPDEASVSSLDEHNDISLSETLNSVQIEDNTSLQFTPHKFLPVGGKIKERSKIIFRFGDNIQAVTVTANIGYVRSAKQQGINFVVFVHESRALTEQKEAQADIVMQ